MMKALDGVTIDQPQAMNASDAVRHLGCDSHSPKQHLISSSKIGWGGARKGSGGARENAGGARENSGGVRLNAGRPSAARAIERLPSGPRWYVIQFASGDAHNVRRNLWDGDDSASVNRPHFDVEIPETAVRVQRWTPSLHRLEWIVVNRPTLGIYGFVKFDVATDNWASIPHCPGVVRLFMTRSMTPIPVPAAFMERLKRDAPARLNVQAQPMETFAPGARLIVLDGSFASFHGTCVSCNGYTSTVAIEILGRMADVTMARAALREAA